uniref:Uncharacterized protein n=1 Tax=Mycena chlorophos TaxID=658473 RepID=A0ABQ0LM00_MYCCL|nr:predicted protein [Mycena chlorophos]
MEGRKNSLHTLSTRLTTTPALIAAPPPAAARINGPTPFTAVLKERWNVEIAGLLAGVRGWEGRVSGWRVGIESFARCRLDLPVSNVHVLHPPVLVPARPHRKHHLHLRTRRISFARVATLMPQAYASTLAHPSYPRLSSRPRPPTGALHSSATSTNDTNGGEGAASEAQHDQQDHRPTTVPPMPVPVHALPAGAYRRFSRKRCAQACGQPQAQEGATTWPGGATTHVDSQRTLPAKKRENQNTPLHTPSPYIPEPIPYDPRRCRCHWRTAKAKTIPIRRICR